MRFAFILAIALTAAACGGGVPPTAPSPATAPSGILWVMVFEEHSDGNCLPDATVQLMIDGNVAKTGNQTPCDYWDDGGGVLFKDLPMVEVTLRASAPGYATREITARPSTGWFAINIFLQRAN